MAKNTSVTLSDYFENFIAAEIASGRYGNTSEVVRAGLRRLEREEKKLEALRAAIDEGLNSPESEDSELVALSCKRRGFCPACLGRRISDTAVHLTQQVLPRVPIRHWIASLSWVFARSSLRPRSLRRGGWRVRRRAMPLAEASSQVPAPSGQRRLCTRRRPRRRAANRGSLEAPIASGAKGQRKSDPMARYHVSAITA